MLGNVLAYTSAACLLMAIGGCAVFQGVDSRPPPGSDPVPTESGRQGSGAETSASRPVSGKSGSPAIVSLINQAEEYIAAEEFQNAGAALERALRIDPKNPELYSRLAGVMLLQGQPDEAESLAKRSNSLAGNWPSLQAKNWAIISRTLRARGDNASADAAEMRSKQLKKLAGE